MVVPSPVLSRLLTGCGGFLLAVLWMDLLFDVQVAGLRRDLVAEPRALHALRSIAAYYRRATIEAVPMNRLIAAVMLVAVAGSLYRVLRSRARDTLALLSTALCTAPVALALARVVPNAMRLGTGADPPQAQLALAQTILHDHLACLVAIGVFTTLEVVVHGGGTRRTHRDPDARRPPQADSE